MITKDTTESDLKQRREIVGNSVLFSDQAPVRAALNGRLLVLDGIENAERNVLPTLNNLLENREMALEDGRFLMPGDRVEKISNDNLESISSRILPVHKDFRVVALSLPVPPYPGRTLDPPLRSRFQSRFVNEPSLDDALRSVNANGVETEKLKAVCSFYIGLEHLRHETVAEGVGTSVAMVPTFSLDNLEYCLHLLRENPEMPIPKALARSFPLGYSLEEDFSSRESFFTGTKLPPQVTKLINYVDDSDASKSTKSGLPVPSATGKWMSHYQSEVLPSVMDDLAAGRHICLLGPKGSGKSYMLEEIGAQMKNKVRTFPLFQELTARDLLQRRSTISSSGAAGMEGDTTWSDSPLIASARSGDICVLDGIDRIDPHSMFVLRRLLQDGEIELPDGEKLIPHPSFRVIGLGLPPFRQADARSRFITSDLGFSYHFLHANNNAADIKKILANNSEDGSLTLLEKYFVVLVGILHDVAFENAELHVSLRHALRCQKILKTMASSPSLSQDPSVVVDVLSEALLVRFLPKDVSLKFYSAISSFNARVEQKLEKNDHNTRPLEIFVDVEAESSHNNGTLTIGDVTYSRRKKPVFPELVPDPLYFDNNSQTKSLESILRSLSTNERAMLLIGNQGVGKNKIIDRLLHLLEAEREYVQVHRDTTIQSLTQLPLLEGGKILYEDSPLVRAVEMGRILLLDEVDKAPLEVVCVLKGLVGDGELVLHSGRRILSLDRALTEWQFTSGQHDRHPDDLQSFKSSEFRSFCEEQNILPIHPDFRLFCLANRPGHPFLGNQFYKECGDLFVCHVIENLDQESEVSLLQSFAPNVEFDILSRLARVFADLRALNEDGTLAYPFSAREAVGIAKHLHHFPEDGIEMAAENILGFEGMNFKIRELVASVFRHNGFDLPVKSLLYSNQIVKDGEGGLRVVGGRGRYEDGQSTPRTGVNMPKHGKIDPDNKPHVGGNTWHGGTGGSDTAGLGGRGGPYRVDSGHQVHQISDEEKAKVSEESRAAAAEMAKEAFEERLEKIKMGQNDYAIYQKYSDNVKLQVEQLKDLLEEICRRGKERIWIRNQSGGELDDGKIVDGLSGERNVYKKRGYDANGAIDGAHTSEVPVRTKVQFVVDVSGSMIRFNGYDGRLERMLESTLMIMQSLPRSDPQGDGDDSLAKLIDYSIAGHSGDSSRVPFIEFSSDGDRLSVANPATNSFLNNHIKIPKGPLNEKSMMQILEQMVAHSQFCWSGDNTVEALELAIDQMSATESDGENLERLVIVISDANFRRYDIDPADVNDILRKSPGVKAHFIMIGSLADEASEIISELPVGKAHSCMSSSDLPAILRSILTASLEQ
eukprot:g8696.t1